VSTYTTNAAVKNELPPDTNSDNWGGNLPDATIDTKIIEWSGYVNDALRHYWPFNDITDTPATPKTIQQATVFLTAWECESILGVSDRRNDASESESLWTKGHVILVDLSPNARGVIERRIEPESITDSVTWGSQFDSHTLLANRWITSVAPKTIFPASVQITNYRNYADFDSFWDETFRGWIIRRIESDIADVVNVTYRFSYLRQTEIDTAAPSEGIIGRA
jgi:hypothetical protein